MKRDLVWSWRGALLAGAVLLGVGACDAIVGAGDRELNDSIVCGDDGCVCAEGHGDCDGLPDNGCEADLGSPESCGACGVPCDNGECQDFTCVCDPGYADCDGEPLTVCETDLTTDPLHCGLCARSCGDAECAAGLCVPEPVTSTGPMYAFALAGQTLYFAPAPDMGMFRMDLGGGPPEPFGDATVYVNLVHHHGDAVYWTTVDGVFVTSTVTGESSPLAPMQVPIRRVTVGGDKVYWANLAPDTNMASLHRAPVTPGGAVEVVTELGDADFVFDFAATEEHVYWNDIGQMMRSPHDMPAPALFKNVATPPTFMEPAAAGILYTGSPGGTFLAPFGAGSASKLADVDGYGVLATDDVNVYFVTWVFGTDDPFEIWRAPLSGEGPTVKIAEEEYLQPDARLAVDDSYVYWIGGAAGEIVRVAK